MEGYVGIFDTDSEYRGCLMRGLLNKEELRMPMVEFTKSDSILIFAGAKRLELLVISDMALTEEILNADIGRVVLLTEEPEREPEQVSGTKSFGCIFKYQPISKIAEEVLRQYPPAIVSAAAVQLYPFSEKTLIYGVYSPVRRCLKSSFAIALAQLMGERQTTLLLSFEAHSALPEMLDIPETACQGNLSDALYYYLQGTLEGHEEELIRACHSFDFISPVKNPEDLESLRPEEVIGFIRYFTQERHYGCVVIDFGDVLSGINRILSCCSRIFMPVKTDWISEKKKEHYLAYVRKTDQAVLSHLEEVRPPYYHIDKKSRGRVSGNFEGLVSGEFYDYVRQCL